MSATHLKPKFYVIAVISNPVRYKSRFELYRKFERHIQRHNAQLFTVEIAFGDRKFEVTDPCNPRHLQLRSWDEIWHKENMINQAIERLPSDWEYVAWVDADIEFQREDWIEETIHQLQHYMIVQMFQTAIDLAPDGCAIATHFGFCYSYHINRPYSSKYYPNWHPGYCWAARREAIGYLGGLIDKAILGAGDRHMALALIGQGTSSVERRLHPNYHQMVKLWEDLATRYIRRDIGFVPGTIFHHWHGKKKDRRYYDRWKILMQHQYDPIRDLKRDWQGLYQLVDHGDLRSIQLRDDLRKYFRSRNEDSIDLE